MKTLTSLISSNNEHNQKLNKLGNVSISRVSRQKAQGSWSHDGYEKEHGDSGAMDEDEDVEMEDERDIPWTAVLTNLHWEILESDLMELFGFEQKENLESCSLSWDNAGRSLGIASLVFKSEALAYDAQRKFNGQILEGRELIFEVKGPYKRRKKFVKKKSSVFSRLGPGSITSRLGPKSDVFSRLAPKIEDRLGKKIEDRLGEKSSKGKNGKKKDTPVKNSRNIRSYADTQVAEKDGQMI